MPSKNSINRPKQKLNLQHRVQKNAAKRSARERAGLLAPPRSSEQSQSGRAKSIPLDLFRGERVDQGPITTKTLSKKRAKKIERNLRYVEQRKLLVDVQAARESGMEIDVETAGSGKTKAQQTGPLQKVKESIWSALEDVAAQDMIVQTGAGTTLGGQFFP
ncbi:AaceriAFL209Wp [[Ashbya] aceris (nom. inval.)]|nr:AaceriAFL209Wp [[Ashbya] aceris (nom. inval.)]